MAHPVHLSYQSAADRRPAEECQGLYGEASPRFSACQQLHVFAEGVACGYGIETVDDLRVSVFQPVRLVYVIVGGVEGEDVHEQTDDTRALALLHESRRLVRQL